MLGIDISNNNGHVAVGAIKIQHPDLVVLGVKATEGTSFHDATFADNFEQGAAAGLVVTPYHFARPSANPGAAGGKREAEFFWSAIKAYAKSPAFGRPVLDYEEHADEAFAAAFVKRIRELSGVVPMVYVSGSRTGEVGHLGCPLWIAAYGSSVSQYVPVGAHMFMWQFTDNYGGLHIDASHVYVDRSELLAHPAPSAELQVVKGGKVVQRIKYGAGRVRAFLRSRRVVRVLAGGAILRKRGGK